MFFKNDSELLTLLRDDLLLMKHLYSNYSRELAEIISAEVEDEEKTNEILYFAMLRFKGELGKNKGLANRVFERLREISKTIVQQSKEPLKVMESRKTLLALN